MTCSRTLTISGDIHEIPQISAALEETMRACGFSDDAILDMQLAVEEAVANTILHGYRGAVGEVTIAIHATLQSVQIRIEDHAPPFDPLSLPEPDRGSDLAERRIGGLGIYLMRQVADEVVYEYTGSKNVLTLVKRKAA
ncbi:MAG: ATP-binding protein [Methanomicrobiales archaeon]|nr:ATP-binding protein [Methanomicrobiales archaeon]